MIEPDLSYGAAGPTSQRTLRQFGGLWLLFFGALASWQWFVRGHQGPAVVLGGVGAVIGALGLLRPEVIRPLFAGLTLLTFPIGWVVSRLLLAVLFYGVFTPVGAFFRLIGRDALSVRPRGDQKTYWVHKPTASDVRSYLRQS
jgi:Saxitoxin biosynthesis operon protein SxtJ